MLPTKFAATSHTRPCMFLCWTLRHDLPKQQIHIEKVPFVSFLFQPPQGDVRFQLKGGRRGTPAVVGVKVGGQTSATNRKEHGEVQQQEQMDSHYGAKEEMTRGKTCLRDRTHTRKMTRRSWRKPMEHSNKHAETSLKSKRTKAGKGPKQGGQEAEQGRHNSSDAERGVEKPKKAQADSRGELQALEGCFKHQSLSIHSVACLKI